MCSVLLFKEVEIFLGGESIIKLFLGFLLSSELKFSNMKYNIPVCYLI
mgnify:CR=1 FL=1